MALKVSLVHGRGVYIGEMRSATIVVSGDSETHEVPQYLDWHWFSDHGFLDTTSGEGSWTWLKPIASAQLDSETIGDFAFDGCQTLQSVSLSSNVKSIGESAFYKCVNLQTVNGLDSVTKIGDWAFDRCLKLNITHVPPSLEHMGKGAFANCENFTGNITIPSGVSEIGEQTFAGCIRLTGITIHSGVNWIGENAFQDCTGLTHITFQGKSLDFVRSMENYPWGANESIIRVS